MPLRDHFRPPVDELRPWESLHSTWPVMIVAALKRHLPKRYYALPRTHSGTSAEVDVATYEGEGEQPRASDAGGNDGGIATAVWAPPRPTLQVVTDLPAQDEYEVQVFDQRRHARLVAAVEIVSPANKDRPDSRQALVRKCAALLKERVSVVTVDVVTTRSQSLYDELLSMIGHKDHGANGDSADLYSAACRVTRSGNEWLLEAWANPLHIGKTLPTMPLWLADNLAVPLELEASYEQSCSLLGIP